MPSLWDILTALFDPQWFAQAFAGHGVTMGVFGVACAGTGFAIGYKLKAWQESRDHRSEDADRLLKLKIADYELVDGILLAEAEGYDYFTGFSSSAEQLRRAGIVKLIGKNDDGDYLTLNITYRPFFERYADAIHEIAEGTNEDRLRIADEVRKGRYRRGRKQIHLREGTDTK